MNHSSQDPNFLGFSCEYHGMETEDQYTIGITSEEAYSLLFKNQYNGNSNHSDFIPVIYDESGIGYFNTYEYGVTYYDQREGYRESEMSLIEFHGTPWGKLRNFSRERVLITFPDKWSLFTPDRNFKLGFHLDSMTVVCAHINYQGPADLNSSYVAVVDYDRMGLDLDHCLPLCLF